MDKVVLENERLKVVISLSGGSMTSIYDKVHDKELLYQPKPQSWQGQDIAIFPFIARLKDGFYTLNGERYELKNHGLLRYMNAKHLYENGSSDSIKRHDICSLIFESNDETRSRYPFDFMVKLDYSLTNMGISPRMTISNTGTTDMPFMCGFHPALALPGILKDDEFNINGNWIQFDQNEEIDRITQDSIGSYCTGLEKNFIKNGRLDLSKKLFEEIPTMILKDVSRAILHLKDGRTYDFSSDASYIALWSDGKLGDFVCIEPWSGVPDFIEPNRDLFKKPGIRVLKPKEKFSFGYTLKFD